MMKNIKKTYLILLMFALFTGATNVRAAELPAAVNSIYEGVDGSLFWVGTRQIERNRKQIPAILENAYAHGLSSTAFNLDRMNELVEYDGLAMADRQVADQTLTYALWRYASELYGMDLTTSQFNSLALSPDMASAVEALAPQDELYRNLQNRLQAINEKMQDDNERNTPPKLDFNGQVLHVGDEHPSIPLLRARLIEYHVDEEYGDAPYIYDALLADAVKGYQEKYGLTVDGIIGPSTIKHINRTLKSERDQVIVNLDRLRDPIWRNRPDLRIDVDIARYWLTAYENGVEAFEMPVVVGSKQRQTVRFSTMMTGVRLNPGWTLPPTIKTEDYIPKLRENPEWVSEQGVKIYADWAPSSDPIDPLTVDWTMLTDNEIKAMRMYKSAGAQNPLGQYRFLMNNKYDIYLHDTNARSLFNRTMRAKSSGCVRVYNPRQVAEFLLKDDPSWTPEKIDEVLASGKTYDVGATRHIPVYFDYKTAWLDEQDELVMGVDVYGFDTDALRDTLKFQRETKQTISRLVNSIQMSNIANTESNDTQDGFPISLF